MQLLCKDSLITYQIAEIVTYNNFMKKYLQILYIVAVQHFAYRLSFILWRLRNVFNLVFTYFLWTSVFSNRLSLFSYTQEKIITYILLITLLSSLVLLTLTGDVAADILSGDIMNYLLKPFSFFKYIISREAGDKLLNLCFSGAEIIILFSILKPQIFIQTNIPSYILFFLSLIIGIILSFLISLSISFIAFWSNEIWAPRWIYSILTWFLAGSFFPLDILPKSIYNFLLLTPFPYLIYLPTKFFLDGFTTKLIIPLVLSIGWCFVLFFMTKKMWERGIKNYSAYGR